MNSQFAQKESVVNQMKVYEVFCRVLLSGIISFPLVAMVSSNEFKTLDCIVPYDVNKSICLAKVGVLFVFLRSVRLVRQLW